LGSLAPLFAVPSSARGALLLRDDEAPGDAGAGIGPALVRLFGDRLKPAESEKLLQAFSSLAKARRGATVLALAPGPPPALLLTCEVSDAEAFSRAVAEVLGLVELAPVSSWLGSTAGKPSLTLAPAADGVRRAKLRFQRSAVGAPLPLPAELFVTWQARDGVGSITLAADSKLGLAPFTAPSRLSSSPWLAESQRRLGDSAALGLFFDAQLLGPAGPEPAPALLTFGKQGERIVLSLEAAPSAVRALSGRFGVDRSP
jgi:hypothetical protein